MAAAQIALMWARTDRTALRNCVSSLPRGESRDGALTAIIGTAGDTRFDEATLALFSTDQARQQAVVNLIVRIAQTDERRARKLVDEHVSDPLMRQRVEQMINARGAFGITNGGQGVAPAIGVIRQ